MKRRLSVNPVNPVNLMRTVFDADDREQTAHLSTTPGDDDDRATCDIGRSPFDADSREVEHRSGGGEHLDEAGQLAQQQAADPDGGQLCRKLVRNADEQEDDVGDGETDEERRRDARRLPVAEQRGDDEQVADDAGDERQAVGDRRRIEGAVFGPRLAERA